MSNSNLQQNQALYPWYQAASSFLPWLPIFFLYFYQQVSLSAVLQLSAIYYFSVFILEVPSGYFSDLLGRRFTLMLSALFGLLAYTLFIISGSFLVIAIAQFMLAACVSFKSGSDNALLYDSLQALDRVDEYAKREANGGRWGLLSMAAAALLGGVSGMIDLSIPYYLSAVGSIVALIISFKFSEPPIKDNANSFLIQVKVCLQSIAKPTLSWLFAFYVLSFALAHIPFEFNQPYIQLLNFSAFSGTDSTALVSGTLIALSMLGGALGASISIQLLEKLGIQTLLTISLILILIIIGGMSAALHPAILILILFRNFPMALSDAPLLAAVAPHIDSSFRATYLSLQSLAGRFGFALFLMSLSGILSNDAQSEVVDWSELRLLLLSATLVGVFAISLLLFLRPKQKSFIH